MALNEYIYQWCLHILFIGLFKMYTINSFASICSSVEWSVLLFLAISDVFTSIISRSCALSPPCNLQRMRWNESLNDFPVTHWPLFYLRDVQHCNVGVCVYLCECERVGS